MGGGPAGAAEEGVAVLGSAIATGARLANLIGNRFYQGCEALLYGDGSLRWKYSHAEYREAVNLSRRDVVLN